MMEKLTLINLLERQIKQEINRIEQNRAIDYEKEEIQLTIYQQLVHTI